MKHNYENRYKNVYLRALECKDIEALREWRNSPENSKYLRKLTYITQEKQKQWYEAYLKNKDEITFAIIESEKLKRIVGSLALYDFYDNEVLFGKILIGDQDAHGKKVGVNATIAALQIAFNELNVERVKLYVYKNNKPALKVYEQVGFKIIGFHLDEYGNEEYTMQISKEELEM